MIHRAFPNATEITVRWFLTMYGEITKGCMPYSDLEEYVLTCLPGYAEAELEEEHGQEGEDENKDEEGHIDNGENSHRGNETDTGTGDENTQGAGSQGRATAPGDEVVSVRGSATWADLTIDQVQEESFDEGVRAAAATVGQP